VAFLLFIAEKRNNKNHTVPEKISAITVIHISRVTNVIASMYNPTIVSPAVYTLTDLP
jgi:hypothetical protein